MSGGRLPRYVIVPAALLLLFTHTMTAQWSEVKLPRPDPWSSLISVEWPDSSTGYVFDTRGVYYKTTDEGATWNVDSLQPPSGFALRYADFITPELGIASFEDRKNRREDLDSIVYITSDGGASWKMKHIGLLKPVSWTNMPYSVIRLQKPGTMYLFYTSQIDPQSRVVAEVIYQSTDLGDTWNLISVDTLRELASATGYIVLDSLRQYKFYSFYDFESATSWVRTSTDGGRTWWRIVDNGHPLARPYFSGVIFDKIHTINDTGLAIVAGAITSWPPGLSVALVTVDVRYKDRVEGWRSFVLPWFASATLDITYNDGVLYALTTTANHGVGDYDSLWIRNIHVASSDKGIHCPQVRLRYLSTSSRDKVWALGHHGGGVAQNWLYRLDRKLVQVEAASPLPASGGMHVYPNPASGRSEVTLTYELAERVNDASISAYDIHGRKISSISIGERGRGLHRETITLASLVSTASRGLYVIVLSTPDRIVTSTTAVVF